MNYVIMLLNIMSFSIYLKIFFTITDGNARILLMYIYPHSFIMLKNTIDRAYMPHSTTLRIVHYTSHVQS